MNVAILNKRYLSTRVAWTAQGQRANYYGNLSDLSDNIALFIIHPWNGHVLEQFDRSKMVKVLIYDKTW